MRRGNNYSGARWAFSTRARTPASTRECRLCHRIGTQQFVPAGSEEWECANDRACRRRATLRAPDAAEPEGSQR